MKACYANIIYLKCENLPVIVDLKTYSHDLKATKVCSLDFIHSLTCVLQNKVYSIKHLLFKNNLSWLYGSFEMKNILDIAL